MMFLRYGTQNTIRLDGASTTSIRPSGGCFGAAALDQGIAAPTAGAATATEGGSHLDLVAQIRRALSQPLDYPPLVQATVPGDTVAVAVPDGLPKRAELMLGVAAALCDAGVEPTNVYLVMQSALEDVAAFRRQLQMQGLDDVVIETHDPDDDEQVAFVGATRDEQPLRLNRRLVDADVKLLLSPPPHPLSRAASGRFHGLFPQFGDRSTQASWAGRRVVGKQESAERNSARPSPASRSPASRTESAVADLADEAGWLLGVAFVLHATPGPGGSVAQVFAGEPAATARAADAYREEIWSLPAPRRGDLAIAALVGDAPSQTWGHVARAVTTARSVLKPGGAVAVCSELSERPGDYVHRLRNAGDIEAMARRLRHEPSADAQTAAALARALGRGPVYLLSRLPPAVVESLGITPIADEAELVRLKSRYRRCVLLHEAQSLVLTTSHRRSRTKRS